MTAKAARTQTNVVYLLQTHTRPKQIARLVKVITEGSPDSVVLISHDRAGPALDVPELEALGNVHVLFHRGGYGDFTHLDRYFAAVDWLEANGIDYGWLENLSGQDYPLRPIAEIENALDRTSFDGFLLYSPVFPERVPPEADQGAASWYRLCPPFDASMRYDYQHWRVGKATEAMERLMHPLMALNLLQPWVRVSNSYATVGIRRRRRSVFGPGFHCYGGSFFCTLRAECVRYVRDYARSHPEAVAFFRTALAPEETFLHSVLVNSGQFKLSTDYKRYIDWTGVNNTHPRTLGVADAPALLASDAHWARKLDLDKDAKLFDLLDQRIRRGRRGRRGRTRVTTGRLRSSSGATRRGGAGRGRLPGQRLRAARATARPSAPCRLRGASSDRRRRRPAARIRRCSSAR
jgi:hypothetical protein